MIVRGEIHEFVKMNHHESIRLEILSLIKNLTRYGWSLVFSTLLALCENKVVRIDRLIALDSTGGGAWLLLLGGLICLVNSVNQRDFSVLNTVKYDA